MGVSLSWANAEYHDNNDASRSMLLNAQALGGVAALNEIIRDMENIELVEEQ